MCVQHTERKRGSRRRSTARVRHGRNDAHEAFVPAGPELAWFAEQLRLHLASGGPCASSASASTGWRRRPPWTKPCRGCKPGEGTLAHAALSKGPTDMVICKPKSSESPRTVRLWADCWCLWKSISRSKQQSPKWEVSAPLARSAGGRRGSSST